MASGTSEHFGDNSFQLISSVFSLGSLPSNNASATSTLSPSRIFKESTHMGAHASKRIVPINGCCYESTMIALLVYLFSWRNVATSLIRLSGGAHGLYNSPIRRVSPKTPKLQPDQAFSFSNHGNGASARAKLELHLQST